MEGSQFLRAFFVFWVIGFREAASALISFSLESGQEGGRGGVVAEGSAEVGEAINIAGGEDEAAAQLKRMLAQFVLAMASGASADAGLEIIRAGEMKQVGGSQSGDDVCLAMLVD